MRKIAVYVGVTALSLQLAVGCGTQQQQADVTKTDTTKVATAPSDQTGSMTQPQTQPPPTPPAAKPTQTKPASGASTPATQPAKPATKEPEPPKLVTVPTGTALTVALETHLRTDSNQVGDRFTGRTTTAVRINDTTAIPAGTEVRGQLTKVEEPHRTAGKAQMTLAFEEIVDPSGRVHAIAVAPLALEGEGDKISDEEKVAGGAVIGGIIGALTSKKKTKGAVTGAAAGAAAGGAIALATKGPQLDLPPGQQFSIELSAPLLMPVSQLTAGK